MILSAAIPAKVRRPKHTTTTTSLTRHHPPKSLNTFPCLSYKLNASSSLANGTSQDNNNKSHQNPNPSNTILHHVNHDEQQEQNCLIPSASAVAAAIRNASTASPVDFVQRIQKDDNNRLVLPSSDFQRLCSEQLDLFRKIIDKETVLSVYVRPAGSYVMDRLELRRVTIYPVPVTVERTDTLVLVGSFGVPTGLRVAEASLLDQQLEVIHEFKAIVFPMVKHPFVVGFLVAEFPLADFEACSNRRGAGQALQLCPPPETCPLPSHSERNKWDLKTAEEDSLKTFHQFTAEQRSNVLHISRSLAMAYIMDQKAMLLQQSSWQNNIRMSELVEQIRGSLSSIRSLSKMLSTHTKRSEISFDIIEDILVQGDQMRDTLQKLQDAVFLTKANIVRYNEETLRRRKQPTHVRPESGSPQSFDNISDGSLPDKTRHLHQAFPLSSAEKDLEMPMPPLALVPLQQHKIRPCNVSDVLADLVGAAGPLAHKLQRTMELSELTQSLHVAVEESALRQALSNLIEGALLRTHAGGKVKIVSTGAPAGGVLVIVDDDGPDMHYMTQMHSLTQFGPDLSSDGMIEDNMTWNFVSGLTVAREILESYGCVVRVISPRVPDPVFGAGGSRIELWFPSHTPTSGSTCSTEEA